MIIKKKNRTRLWRNNQLLKEENKDATLDVPYIISNMGVTKFPTQRENDQTVIDNREETKMLKPDAGANASVKRSNIQRRLNDQEILTLKVPFLVKESILKRMWLYYKRTCLEKEMTKGVLTFNKMLHLLKEVFMTYMKFIMLSHKCNKMSTSNICYLISNNIISWDIKEQINMIVPFDEAKLSTAGCSGKQLLWVKQMLKKCNVRRDIMTFVSNILKSLYAVNFEKGVWICEIQYQSMLGNCA